LLGEKEDALQALERALQLDASLKELAKKNDDLKPLRNDPRFEKLVR